jgi:hypothetical protein
MPVSRKLESKTKGHGMIRILHFGASKLWQMTYKEKLSKLGDNFLANENTEKFDKTMTLVTLTLTNVIKSSTFYGKLGNKSAGHICGLFQSAWAKNIQITKHQTDNNRYVSKRD